MKITTKQLVQTALLLAICIASQYFKNLSVYITGPIVNLTIILAVLSVGLWSGLLLSIIAPVTAFFFTGSPIMAAIPPRRYGRKCRSRRYRLVFSEKDILQVASACRFNRRLCFESRFYGHRDCPDYSSHFR